MLKKVQNPAPEKDLPQAPLQDDFAERELGVLVDPKLSAAPVQQRDQGHPGLH